MAREQLKTLTEPMYYLLLALIRPQHGYGIMQSITEMTENRVQVGAGTLYALLSRFEGEGIIAQIMEKDRKKIYQITPKGAELLTEEFCRLNRMVEDGKRFFDSAGTLLPITYEPVLAEAAETQAAAEEKTREKTAGAPSQREERKGEDGKEGAGGEEEKKERENSGKEEKGREEEKDGNGERQGFRGGFRNRKGIFAT
ncbi:PadR family transcriptional regulator [Bacilliculturomica massiliensis]|uniref:PadR family transcriptional regulator n=1 Tax=Bacilliculturomica massiliensis TaxID=1917867 RepID=UPI00102FD217|nr:helix-turn-helix transcriptional regulator [Bacilliculturomica massiliensis]